MRFSIYSEIQQHDQTPEQLYAEVLEQIVNADRLGYDTYAAVEHYFFPKFSISRNPTALFAAAAQRTRNIRFRTMLHALPYHNPLVLASAIAATDILTGGRYEFGVGRGHGWIPTKAGAALDEDSRARYEDAVDLLFKALANERFSHHGPLLRRRRHARRPVPAAASSASTSAARRTAPTSSRPRTAGASRCRRCSPTSRSRKQLDLYRASLRRSTARRPTSSGSTPATSTTTARRRCARRATGCSSSSRATPRR